MGVDKLEVYFLKCDVCGEVEAVETHRLIRVEAEDLGWVFVHTGLVLCSEQCYNICYTGGDPEKPKYKAPDVGSKDVKRGKGT